jgi:hypothetical protein
MTFFCDCDAGEEEYTLEVVRFAGMSSLDWKERLNFGFRVGRCDSSLHLGALTTLSDMRSGVVYSLPHNSSPSSTTEYNHLNTIRESSSW